MKNWQRAMLNQEMREQRRILNEQRAQLGMEPVSFGTGMLKAAGILFVIGIFIIWMIKG
ncbi:MAG TPA: hypothetical protein VFF14_01410 [Candidatus Deferrimicrobium sp.]|nr:hypothetical protein [Candidatus Deferrimicrobium sp.]